MNLTCATSGHCWEKVYPDQDLIDGIIFKQEIEEIWECQRPGCGKAKRMIGTVGTVVPH